MMSNMSCKRTWLILLLALILPVQGIAAAFAPVHRVMNPDAMATMPCHTHVAEHAAEGKGHAPSPSHQPDGDFGDFAPHACCHQVMNAAPEVLVPATARKFADVSRVVLPLATLYIPESPDRPPRG